MGKRKRVESYVSDEEEEEFEMEEESEEDY